MFLRTIKQLVGQKAPDSEVWKDKVQQATQYEDRVDEVAKFTDAPEVLYAAQLDPDGGYTVLKDTGLTPKMMHTFAGWPISAPVGKVTDPDPLAPKAVEAQPVDAQPKG